MISNLDKYIYITAFSAIFGVKEEKVARYAKEHGMHALTSRPYGLLSGTRQQEKMDAFDSLREETKKIKKSKYELLGPGEAFEYIRHRLNQINSSDQVFLAVYTDPRHRVIGDKVYHLKNKQQHAPKTRAILTAAVKRNARNMITAVFDPNHSLQRDHAFVTKHRAIIDHLSDKARLVGITLCDSFVGSYSLTKEGTFSWANPEAEIVCEAGAFCDDHHNEKLAKAYAAIVGVEVARVGDFLKNRAEATLLRNPSELLRTPGQLERHRQLTRLISMAAMIESQSAIIENPLDAANFIRATAEDIHHQETFSVLFLDDDNRLLSYKPISKGGMQAAVIDPRDIFRYALEYNATKIIVGHNHPSGDVSPSRDDINSFQRLREAGAVMDIAVVDQVIVSGVSEYEITSFVREGIALSIDPYEGSKPLDGMER